MRAQTEVPLQTSNHDALLSLEGLSTGDAFGECFFFASHAAFMIDQRQLPPALWHWTDDTHMAISIVRVLHQHGSIDQDALAQAFAQEYVRAPDRGYGKGAARLLSQIAGGADWRDASPRLFSGGSYGNGAAMRAAPIGGFFRGDPARAAQEGQLAAVVTHAHPEGQAGGIAVAVAGSIAASESRPQGAEFLRAVLPFVPDSQTKEGIQTAVEIPADRFIDAMRLGTGAEISAQDTVPFCLWSAALTLDNYEEAMWQTIAGFGDCDTTCAIVGGIVALASRRVPASWVARREKLPDDLTELWETQKTQ